MFSVEYTGRTSLMKKIEKTIDNAIRRIFEAFLMYLFWRHFLKKK